jgi:hypothetical protein
MEWAVRVQGAAVVYLSRQPMNISSTMKAMMRNRGKSFSGFGFPFLWRRC